LFLQAPPAPTGTAQSADDRSTAFRAVQGGQELQSGERLLVIAYMAIWLLLMALVALSFRKQARLNQRIVALEDALAKTRTDGGKAPEKALDDALGNVKAPEKGASADA
jgi:CcmD family protein